MSKKKKLPPGKTYKLDIGGETTRFRIPGATPKERMRHLVHWAAEVHRHPDLGAEEKTFATQITIAIAQRIADEEGRPP